MFLLMPSPQSELDDRATFGVSFWTISFTFAVVSFLSSLLAFRELTAGIVAALYAASVVLAIYMTSQFVD